MMNISLSLPFLMTLNLGITALPRDGGGRRRPPNSHPCDQDGAVCAKREQEEQNLEF